MTWGEVLHTYGLATLLVLFAMAGFWFGSTYFIHLLLGNHKTGQVGIFQQVGVKILEGAFKVWRKMEASMTEQTNEVEVARIRGDAATTLQEENARSLDILVKSEKRPSGRAWVAQETIADLGDIAAELQVEIPLISKVLRLLGSQFPDIRGEIDGYCDTIEQGGRMLTERLLREKTKAAAEVKVEEKTT